MFGVACQLKIFLSAVAHFVALCLDDAKVQEHMFAPVVEVTGGRFFRHLKSRDRLRGLGSRRLDQIRASRRPWEWIWRKAGLGMDFNGVGRRAVRQMRLVISGGRRGPMSTSALHKISTTS
jgi:hypothetical protein